MTLWKPAGLLGVMILVTWAAGACEDVRAESLTIGAAHSLKPALREILPKFETQYGATVRVIYGPSQTLRQQIEEGAPIDVFLPAAVEEVEKLEKKGLTLNGGVQIYAQTSLVLVASTASPATPISFRDLLSNRTTRIALGDPKTSALGEITAQVLAKIDPTFKSRSHILYGQHSEMVELVRTGEADVGIVYRVDAITSGQVRVIDEAPAGTYVPVQFGEAIVWTCRNASIGTAQKFLDFMLTPSIQGVLQRYGFDSVSTGKKRVETRKH